MLIRGRQVSPELYSGDVYPIVLTMEHTYEVQREDGLPTSEQHEAYGELLLPILDAMNGSRIGVHVFADTHDGMVREWFYVSDLKKAAGLIKEHAPSEFSYEIMYDDDPEWESLDSHVRQFGYFERS